MELKAQCNEKANKNYSGSHVWEETLIFHPVCNNFDKNFEENINDENINDYKLLFKLNLTVPVIKSSEVILVGQWLYS